jgi:uncharacterized protein YraI
MKRTTRLLIPMVAGAALFASAAQAASGYTINRFHLYSGPGHNFTRVEAVPENARVHIFGCTPSFDWCDVSWGSARGWIDANGLESYYAGRRARVADAGPSLNIPTISFSSTYYREGPQWRDMDEDGDGIPNDIDRDRDGDGVLNRDDAYPDDPDRD